MGRSDATFDQQVAFILRTYGDADFNTRYYGYMSHRTHRLDRAMKIIIAIGTTGSSISGWAVWKYGVGAEIWAVTACIASLLAITQPILNLNKTQEGFDRVWAAYNLVKMETYYALERIARDPTNIARAISSVEKLQNSIRSVYSDDKRIHSRRAWERIRNESRKEIARDLPPIFREQAISIFQDRSES